MAVVLGIDAAWTPNELSGIAVVASRGSRWEVRGLAPSYEAFFRQANGERLDWSNGAFHGSAPVVEDLLAAAVDCAGEKISVVAIDMPIATRPITGRRVADDAISTRFGGAGCGTHTPSTERPGRLGADLTRDFRRHGFPVAGANASVGAYPCLLEVYPHPALLRLLTRNYRVPYKIGKSKKYWPGADKYNRIENVLQELGAIHDALRGVFGETGLVLPRPAGVPTFAALEKYEQALDALVCAWVGVRYLAHDASPFGDETAAIWVPV